MWPHKRLEEAEPDVLREMVKSFAEAPMSAEADALCGATFRQCSGERGGPPQRIPRAALRHAHQQLLPRCCWQCGPARWRPIGEDARCDIVTGRLGGPLQGKRRDDVRPKAHKPDEIVPMEPSGELDEELGPERKRCGLVGEAAVEARDAFKHHLSDVPCRKAWGGELACIVVGGQHKVSVPPRRDGCSVPPSAGPRPALGGVPRRADVC
jgi:hypothetical protein